MTWLLKLTQQLIELFTNLHAWLLLISVNPKIRGRECLCLLSLRLGLLVVLEKDTMAFLEF